MKNCKFTVPFLLLLSFLYATKVSAQEEIATAQYERATELYQQRAYDQSLTAALAADSIYHALGNTLAELQSKLLTAKIYNGLRQFQQVTRVSELAAQLLIPAGQQDSLLEADLRNTYGSSLLELRRYDECEAAFQRAIEIKEKVYGKNTPLIGIQVSNLSNLYFKKGELAKAIQFGQRGIALREGGISPNPLLLTAYTNLGIFHKQVGLYQQALAYYNKVEQVITADPEKYRQKAAPLYQSLASLYHNLGDVDQSKQYAELAILNFSRESGPQSEPVGDMYYNLALLAGDLKDHTGRIEYAQKALTIFQSNQEPDPARIANCYEQLCLGFLERNPDSSLYYANLSRQLLIAADAYEGLDRASNLSYIAEATLNKGDFRTADSLMTIAVAEVRSIYGNQNILTANYLSNHAALLVAVRQYDAALNLYDASLAAYGYTYGCKWDTVVQADQLLENLSKKNRILALRYDQEPTLARKNAIEAGWKEILDLLDYLRRRHQGNEAKLLFADQFRESAETAIKWYARGKDRYSREMAWQFAEKARSLALLEVFRNATAWNTNLPADSLRALADAFSAERKKWYDLYTAAENAQTRGDYLLKLVATDKRQEAWLHVLESQDSLFFKAKYDNRIITPKAVSTLLQPDQALLEYFVGDSSIYLFVIRPDTFIIREVKRDFPLEDWIEQLRQGLYGYYTMPKSKQTNALFEKSLNQYTTCATQLQRHLIAPVQEWLPAKVIVVTDGLLGYIPFDALLTAVPPDLNDFKSYPYLFRRHQFSFAYSATLLQEMRDKKHRREPSKAFVAFAPFYTDPVAGSKDPKSDSAPTRSNLDPLLYSGPGVVAAAKLLDGDVFIGSAATKAQFEQIAGEYRVLFLATHASADNHTGSKTFLAFAEIQNSPDSTYLYLKDLYNLRLNADLVVLSACETGVGKLERGEGVLSLARAFAYAGAKSMVTTLWKVNDKSTAAMMEYFCRALQQGKSKDEALQFARSEYFKTASGYSCHPFFWAGFVPVGDMRPVKK